MNPVGTLYVAALSGCALAAVTALLAPPRARRHLAGWCTEIGRAHV